MPAAVCHFPVTVRLHGELTDDHVASLAAGLESALAGRLAAARAEIASRRRPPASWPGSEPAHERLDRSRLVQAKGRYLLPSFGAAAEPAADPAAPALPHPTPTDPRADVVEPSPSAFEGQTVAILPASTSGGGWQALRVSSRRHAVTTDLSRAVGWGSLLFGAGSFAILEGPFGEPDSRYHVVGIHPRVSDADIARASLPDEAGRYSFMARYWQQVHDDAEHRPHQLRALFTSEGTALFPGNRFWLEEYLRELKATDTRTGLISPEYAAPMVFGEIEALLASDDIEEAARQLAKLDATAFRIVDWETRARYVETLVKAWTWEEQEVAIVELFKASSGPTELRATVALLERAGIYEQLFDDLDSQLFSLLVTVGKAHGERGPVTLQFLLEMMQGAKLLPANAQALARSVALGATPDIVDVDLLAELEQAAYSFVNVVGASLESVVLIVSHPDKVVEGIGQLAKLAYTVYLAQWGHGPSIEYLAKLLEGVGPQVVWGVRGADLLGVTEQVTRRVRWALIWEVASLFVGVGEVAAAIKGLAAGERAASAAKLLAMLRRIGAVARGERVAERLPRLATVMKSATTLVEHEDEMLRLIAHLPDEDVARLATALEHVDELPELTMAAMAKRSGEAAQAAEEALHKAELLKALAAKAGGLNDEVTRLFGRLLGGADGLGADAAAEIVRAIPEGELHRFARALDAVPADELGKAGVERLRGLAGSPKRMDAVADLGYDTYRALESRLGGRLDLLDDHLDVLTELEQKFGAADRYADYRRYLDHLADGNPRAWDHLHDARKRPPGQRGLPSGLGERSEWTAEESSRFERHVMGFEHREGVRGRTTKPAYIVRVSAAGRDKGGGMWGAAMFANEAEARRYATWLASHPEEELRRWFAIPHQWVGGDVSAFQAVKVFEVPPGTAFLQGPVAPQLEAAARAVAVPPGASPEEMLRLGEQARAVSGGGPQVALDPAVRVKPTEFELPLLKGEGTGLQPSPPPAASPSPTPSIPRKRP